MQGGYGNQGWPQGSAAGPGSTAVPVAQAGYEFSPQQDQKIARLGNLLILSGILQILWGLGQGTTSWLFGLGQWLYNAPISLALIIIGIMLCLAGSSFKKIRATKGDDIQHLMDALGRLSAATLVQIIGFLLAMVLGVVVVVSIGVLFTSLF